MRKITLLFTLLLTTTIGFSQIINRPSLEASGIISTLGNDGTGIFSADQFELSAETTLSTLEVFGFISNLDFESVLLGFNVVIYSDSAGIPSGNPFLINGGVVELMNIDLSNVSSLIGNPDADFLIDLTAANGGDDVVLPAGTYWMVAYPSVDSAVSGAGRWNWESSDATPTVEPVLIDPADAFQGGITSWSNIAGIITQPFTSLSWRLEGAASLSSEDTLLANAISVFPNPTSSNLNISFDTSVGRANVQITNVSGQIVMNDTIEGVGTTAVSTSDLASGAYFAQITTDNATTVVQFVKN